MWNFESLMCSEKLRVTIYEGTRNSETGSKVIRHLNLTFYTEKPVKRIQLRGRVESSNCDGVTFHSSLREDLTSKET